MSKNSRKVKIAVIGGSGFEKFFDGIRQMRVGTPYGFPPPLILSRIGEKDIVFLPRHGLNHSIPPHRVNYRANIHGLHSIGVERIIAINAVGAINPNFKPGDLVIPHDFADFTKLRPATFHDEAPVKHIDVTQPYCPEIRRLMSKISKDNGIPLWDTAILVCTEGPRFETAAEIEMFRRLGFDIVGMSGVPEVVLARELGICYASLCFVTNMAAGMQERLTPSEVVEISKQVTPKVRQILIDTIVALPLERTGKCPCASAPEYAGFK